MKNPPPNYALQRTGRDKVASPWPSARPLSAGVMRLTGGFVTSPLHSVLLATLLLAGCTAVGVPYSSSPSTKLDQAMDLVEHQGRPLPAEQLIVDAISDYTKAGDAVGLAGAYRAYGLFFRSRTLSQENYASHYKQTGFLDHEAKFAERYARAMHYFELAEAGYKAANKKDLLSNVYFHMGDVATLQGDLVSACQHYLQSKAVQAAFRTEDPKAFSAEEKRQFDGVLQGAMANAKCP